MMVWFRLENGDQRIVPVSRIKVMEKPKDAKVWTVYLTDEIIYRNIRHYLIVDGNSE